MQVGLALTLGSDEAWLSSWGFDEARLLRWSVALAASLKEGF
jgi:hypothetical protein